MTKYLGPIPNNYGTITEELHALRFLIRCVVMDWGDRCDNPDECECSMAQLTRYSHLVES